MHRGVSRLTVRNKYSGKEQILAIFRHMCYSVNCIGIINRHGMPLPVNAAERSVFMASLAEKRLFLLDMDGTLYLDDRLFDKVPEFLALIRRRGGRYLFLTNNSSRGVEGYMAKMSRLGIGTAPEDYLTSADAAQHTLLTEFAGRKCYVSGTASLKRQLAQAGIDVTDALSDGVDVLLSGFDTELTFQKLEDSCILLNRGVPWLATNPDWVCPTWYGSVPDCGSVCEMLSRATGRTPRFLGKPRPEMVHLALKRTGFAPQQAVIIGDRLYTDVACGVNAGIDSIFLLSGEGVTGDIVKYRVNPTWIYENIAQLYHDLEEITL